MKVKLTVVHEGINLGEKCIPQMDIWVENDLWPRSLPTDSIDSYSKRIRDSLHEQGLVPSCNCGAEMVAQRFGC